MQVGNVTYIATFQPDLSLLFNLYFKVKLSDYLLFSRKVIDYDVGMVFR